MRDQRFNVLRKNGCSMKFRIGGTIQHKFNAILRTHLELKILNGSGLAFYWSNPHLRVEGVTQFNKNPTQFLKPILNLEQRELSFAYTPYKTFVDILEDVKHKT